MSARRKAYLKAWRDNPANAGKVAVNRKKSLSKANERYRDDAVFREAQKAKKLARVSVPEHRIGRLLCLARHRAKKMKRDFSIVLTDLLPAPTHCPVLGIPLDYTTIGQYERNFNRASIDRVDSAKGYTPGNVRVISNRANSLKSNATVAELTAILDYMLIAELV